MEERALAEDIRIRGGTLYRVGGAVRDRYMGIAPKDVDYVVTGMRVEDMPFEKIAGQSFPVFLAEVEGKTCEIAMARTEKKNGTGYHGFDFFTSPEITIEQDLARRDLTMNAMARNVLTNEFIDPFDGRHDIDSQRLKHVSEAFKDDPLRVYRVARFASQFSMYVDASTERLMVTLVPELHFLPGERVGMEFMKVLSNTSVFDFIQVLSRAYALSVHFKEVDALGVADKHDGTIYRHTLLALQEVHFSSMCFRPECKFAILVHDLGKALSAAPPVHHGHDKHEHLVDSLGARLALPKKLINYGKKFMRLHMKVKELHKMRPSTLIKLVDEDTLDMVRLSKIESGHRYSMDDYHRHLDMVATTAEVKQEITGATLVEEGIAPGPMFGARLLERRVKELKRRL